MPEWYVARIYYLFAQLIDKYCNDEHGRFKFFSDDIRPQNMLVNSETLRITDMLDD